MNALDAAKPGGFKIGNEFDANRLGFGAMRITGDGIWANRRIARKRSSDDEFAALDEAAKRHASR